LATTGHRYNLLELAHGHSAVLGILAEVLMRVELSHEDADHSHDSGVILIDEPEVHLHLELQERILPALVKMFPHLQFIVATHSPVVVSSIDNAIVFDLQDREPRHSEDLRGRPYGWIMKRHFGLEEDFDLATTELLHELDTLRRLESPTPVQQARLEELAELLSDSSHALALEVWNRVLASRVEHREAQRKVAK
jgi:predicted ATP-binding protein involved in virulence